MSTRSATLAGFGAALLWASLGLLTAASGPVPPFQLLALTFATGGLLGVAGWSLRPDAARALRQRPAVWALGVGGLFGYHALYFAALKLAPPAEAGRGAYLWPRLIVLCAAALPGARLHGRAVAGACLGLAGIVVLGAGRTSFADAPAWPGYLCALAAAFVWAGYSVLSRRVRDVPTDAVTGFCLATAALGLACHLALEETVWPETASAWLAIALNGLGPVGAAFYLWDIGVKRGDIRLLGVGSYAIPVASTAILVGAGYGEPSLSLGLAAVLIAAGAAVATVRARSGRTRCV